MSTEAEAQRSAAAIQDKGRQEGRDKRRAASPQLAPGHDLLPTPVPDRPVRAAPGWCRIGTTSYPIGHGPLPTWDLTPVSRPLVTHQRLLS